MSMADKLISPEPATGATLWSGPISNVDAEVARARAAWPAWAAQPLSYRIETLRRFANVVRGKNDKLADLIARETGKPIWEALTEVDSVINKVEIRSEEHTSELQSLMRISYAVFCLKNKKENIYTPT